jgi:lysophospholipase L1-like esterase
MIDCLILGDSIAVGTHSARPECVAYAKTSINSKQFNKEYPQEFSGKIVVISLGSNDHKYIKTEKELFKLRERVQAEKVYWILPAGNSKSSEIPIVRIQEHVESIAEMYGDWIIRIPSLSKDGIHPTGKGYKKIGDITK